MAKWKQDKGWFSIEPNNDHTVDTELTYPTVKRLQKRMGMVKSHLQQALEEFQEADSLGSSSAFADVEHGLDMVIANLATALHNAHRAKFLASSLDHEANKDRPEQD